MKDPFLKPKLLVLGLFSLSAFGQSSKIQQQHQELYIQANELDNQGQTNVVQPLYQSLTESSFEQNLTLKKLLASLYKNEFHSEQNMLAFLEREKTGSAFNKGAEAIGNHYFKYGQYTDAIYWLNQTSPGSMSPKQKDLWLLKLSFAYIQNKQFEEATLRLNQVGSSKHFDQEKKYYQGYLAYATGDYEKASRDLENVEGAKTTYILLDIEYKAGAFTKVVETGEPYYPKTGGVEKKAVGKMLGDAYFNFGEYDKSILYLERYKGPGAKVDNTHLYMLGFAYYKSEKYEEAINQFNKIVSADDEVAQNAYYHLGASYLKMEKKSEALNAFKNAAGMDYNSNIRKDADFNYAKLSFAIGNPYESATDVMIRFVDQYPDSEEADEVSRLVIQSYITEQNYSKGINYLEKIGPKENYVLYHELLTLYGLQLYNQRSYAEASQYLDKAGDIQASPKARNKALFWSGESAYNQDQFAKAEKQYNQFLKTNPRLNTYENGLICYNLGYSQFKQENYSEAISNFQKYVANNASTDAQRKNDTNLRIADAYFIEGDNWKAMQYYNKVISNNKEDVDYASYQKALCYGLVRKNKTKIEVLSQFETKFPNSKYRDDAYFQLASTLSNTGRYQESIENFNKLISKFPNSQYQTKSYLKKGLAEYNSNQNQEAITSFKALVENFPNSQESAQAVKNLEQIYIDLGQISEYAKWVKKYDFIDYSENDLADAMYESAQQKYLNKDFKEATIIYEKFLKSYPKDVNSLNAEYECAISYQNTENFDKAAIHFERVLERENNAYTLKSAEKLAVLYLEKGNQNKALPVLIQLNNIAKQAELLKFAQSNIMKIYTDQSKFKEASNYAKNIIENPSSDKELITDAKYTLAKSAVASNDLKQAVSIYDEIAADLTGEAKSEAYYYSALYLNQNKSYEKSNAAIKKLIRASSNFPYWGAKGLLVMSDNYHALGDEFQASYILESVIKTYTEYKEIRQEAEKKLDQLKENKKENE